MGIVHPKVNVKGKLHIKKIRAELVKGEEGGGTFSFGSKDKIDPYCKIFIDKAKWDKTEVQTVSVVVPHHSSSTRTPELSRSGRKAWNT